MHQLHDRLLQLHASYKINVSPLPDPDASQGAVESILTIVFTITGALALVFLVAGGMRYISSQGDPQEVSKAKGTLIYAFIGLFVSISAVAIVTFVLGRVV